MKTDYKEGDDVWIAGIDNGKLTKGKVLLELDLSKHGYVDFPHWVIEIQTAIDPLLEIRDAFTMSEDAEGPLGYCRSWANRYKEGEKNEG